MKNPFLFHLKRSFWSSILRYLNFPPEFLGHTGNRFDQKPKVISKFMTSSTWNQMITTRTLLNISKSKGNQTTEFGQLWNVI